MRVCSMFPVSIYHQSLLLSIYLLTLITAIYYHWVQSFSKLNLCDPFHILSSEYELLQSGRRYRAQQCKLNWFKNSFVPVSFGILNSSPLRLQRLYCSTKQQTDLCLKVCIFLFIYLFIGFFLFSVLLWTFNVCWCCVSICVRRV